MNSNILVIEDTPEMAELACMYLSKSGLNVESAASAEEALELIGKKLPDLIILDLNLPGMSGFDFLKEFRQKFSSSIPVIVVSARDADEDIIRELSNGADEFVTKPYSPKVLLARVESILRRHADITAAAEASYEFGPYTILLNSCVLKKGPEKIPLSTKEYEVLSFLISHEGETVVPEKIYNEVWKAQFGDVTAVAVYIQRLRKKIEEVPSSPKYIKTVFGMGYKFERNEE